jgi:tetratricopeptide (TPR) repeat protein
MTSGKFIAITLGVVLLVAGCSVKKNNIISRSYHNTTARYNGYYHGKIKMKDAVDRLAEQHEDKYDRILSVFRYADKQKAKSIYPDMDEVIKKVSLVIQRHSMNIGGKERCRWIDDNWLLMGKSHFFKHDYFSAIETFEYIAATYPDQSSKYEALLWLTQTNIALTKFASCEFTLDYLKSEPKFPKSLRGELYAVLSDFYLQTRQYTQAIESLEKAVVFSKNRDRKIRLMFILAQVYQHENQYKKAFQHYTNCIHMNPPYEMGFNARINRARCFDSENKDSKEVKKELVKMLKDEKNKDYLDQVYYALAGLAIKEPDTTKAIEHLNSSVQASKGNGNQKALSYLDLGKIYFAKREYKLAKLYYDSTMASLSNDYYEYDIVLNRRNSLTKLMKNFNTIALEDSLQLLAKLPEGELKSKLERLAKEQVEEELRRIEKEKMEKQAMEQQQMPQGMQDMKEPFGGNESSGAWYFYNQQAMSFGYNDFIKRWGQRKSEDNWRRINKEAIIPVETGEDEASADTTAEEDPNDPEVKKKKVESLVKKFLAKIPVNQKMIEASDKKILEAYYSNGLIYKESLYDLPAASETFLTMMQRFPDNKYMLQTYYHLYRIYLAMGDDEKREYYENILLNQYPESEYAALIRNPDKGNVTSATDSLLNKYYEDTYARYLLKEYVEVISRKRTSDSLFPASPLMPKFDFLKTLAIGHTNPVPVFEASLNGIVKNYPTDPVKNSAQEILDAIHGVKKPEGQSVQTPDSNAFVFSADTVHLVAVVILQKSLNSNELRIKLSDYNNLYYSLRELKISAQQLDKDRPVIIIQDFPDKSSAQDYAVALKEDPTVFGTATPGSFELLVISAGNYVTLLQERDIEKYLTFYDQNYF